MEKIEEHIAIENYFRKKIHKDKNIQNAFLLVHSEKHVIHLNLAEGSTGTIPAHPKQPF